MPDLAKVRELASHDSGLCVSITVRRDGTPAASVVNAGVIDHPMSGEPVVAFVARGRAMKLRHLRDRPRITLVFRSGWEWIAVEGDAALVGPNDDLDRFDRARLPELLRVIYAAAVGGNPEDWARLDSSMAAEQQTAVLIAP